MTAKDYIKQACEKAEAEYYRAMDDEAEAGQDYENAKAKLESAERYYNNAKARKTAAEEEYNKLFKILHEELGE